MPNRVTVLRRGLMLSASFPAFALFAVPAQAQEVVTIDAPTTVAVANAKINTAVPAEPDLKVSVTAAGAITGPGTVVVTSLPGNGDGAVTLSNAGKLGATDAAGVVTDTVGLTMTGAGATKAGNTATVANSGLVTGGVTATNYGGAVSVTNSGKVYGGISADGFGNTTVETTKGSTVSSGNIAAIAQPVGTTKGDGDFTTTKAAGGNAKIVSAGDVVSVDGKTKGSVFAIGVADASATVDGVAGAVSAQSVPAFTTVTQKALAPAADKTVVTAQSTATRNTGSTATVAIGANGKVDSATANAGNSATVTVAGAVENAANATFGVASNTTTKSSVTQNAAGITTATLDTSSTTANGPDSKVSVAETGSVGSATAVGHKSAAVEIAGASKGAVTAQTNGAGADTTFSDAATFTDKGVIQTTTSKTTSTFSGGAATVSVATTGKVDGAATANGVGGATVTNAGMVKGSATALSNGKASEVNAAQTFDAKGVLATSQTSTTTRAVGGAASVTVAKGGTVLGGVSANGDAGAKIVNSGIIGDDTAPSFVTANSARFLTSESRTTSSVVSDATSTTNTATSKTVSGTVGSTASVTNEAGALINGPVTVNGLGGATVVNAGTVRGTTSATSQGATTANENSNIVKVTTAAGPPAITTNSTKSTSSSTTTVTGGSVAGTYSGVNGTLNFAPAVDGSITQAANKDSSATISATVFGTVRSIAGNADNAASTSSSDITTVLDVDGTGTRTGTTGSTNSSTSSAGTSTVNVSGVVGLGNAGAAPNVSSQGTTGSNVAVSGKIEGQAQSSASGITATSGDKSTTYAQTVTKGVAVTNTLTNTENSKTTVTGGAAKAELTGTGTVINGVTVNGVSEATASVAAGAKVGTAASNGSLSVSTSGTDISTTLVQSYSRDSKTGVVTAQSVDTYVSGPAAASGNASASVAGTVFGSTSVNSARGDATALITGVSEDGLSVSAAGTQSTFKTTTNAIGKAAASAGTTPGTLIIPPASDITTNSSTTAVGGKASATINTAAELQSKGVVGVVGNVSAAGVGGAAVGVTTGSKVGGSVQAQSLFTNNVSETKRVTGTIATTETVSSTNSLVGGAASVTNAGTIGGSATARSATSAEMSNTGKIGTLGAANVVTADALDSTLSSSTSDNDVFNANPATRVTVSAATSSAVGGDAKVTNAASGVILGNVAVSGKTGSVTNNGVVVGTTTLGEGVADYTVTTTRTASTTTPVLTSPAARFTQTYTANQNGLSGGFVVTGATVANPVPGGAPVLQTSTVNAVINLNSGSTTLGNIDAQRNSATGARLTNTTLNLVGSGFLGADVLALTPASQAQGLRTPLLTLSQDKLEYLGYNTATGAISTFAGGTTAVRVLGVETVNKTGAGTFVIVGGAYIPAATVGALPTWTMDVGNFNITGGEVQLAVVPTGTNNQFGINGNVTNAASLVLGRRTPTAIRLIGDSLVGDGPERIAGITVRQTGNFTQSASGTTVVGITPSLVRFGSVTVQSGGTSNEPLGPLVSGVNVPYYTTAQNAGLPSANSRVDITGNLNLAGSVLVNVTRDSLFVNGDGYTLFTYTGTGAVSASATSSLASPFVKFGLVHDTAAKTVKIAATRSSYTSGANNPNAKAAAAGLDSALPEIVNRIRTDAAGGAGYSSVSQIGYAQDLANLASALDFRLTSAQAAQLFDELSSAEFYGSLSAVNQNAVFGDTVNLLATRRGVGETLGSQLWVSPVGNFAKIGGTEFGASRIKADTYGGAVGFDFAYLPNGVVGIGGAYAEHKVRADGTAEEADGRTWTMGMYLTQGFGPIYVNASLAYGFTNFEASRHLSLLARRMDAEIDAKQFDGMLEAGYDFSLGGAILTPFAKAAFRSQSFDAFTETNGGGAGVAVKKHSHTTFLPSIGFKLAGVMGDAEGVSVRPFMKAAYTFQNDIGSDRSVTLLGGGSDFILRGVNPDGFGSIEAGIDGSLGGRVRMFAAGGYSFGGDNSIATARAGLGFRF